MAKLNAYITEVLMRILIVLSTLTPISTSPDTANEKITGSSKEEDLSLEKLTSCKKSQLKAIMARRSKNLCELTEFGYATNRYQFGMVDNCVETCPIGKGYCRRKKFRVPREMVGMTTADCMCEYLGLDLTLKQAWTTWLQSVTFNNMDNVKSNPCTFKKEGTDCSHRCPGRCSGQCGSRLIPYFGKCYCYEKENNSAKKEHTWLPVSVAFAKQMLCLTNGAQLHKVAAQPTEKC